MSSESITENELVQDESSVWTLKDHRDFAYSEGAESERYLERVLRTATDLGSTSSELESHIKDWSSEYHLTTKRAQLLSGFKFDRSLRVLEVGCGCGAITRYLGETFDDVVSIEGSLHRARLARLRTRDLPGVTIVCAPFQDLRFSRKFDVIFCIGVYEYSSSFVDAADPYDAVLRYFSDMLTPNGIVVIAIENQFGLKYFSSATEDHVGVMFEGLEGYHSGLGKVRTFGKVELEHNLRRHFGWTTFYYPYPDYKLPDCVLAEELVASGAAGELVSQLKSRDYSGDRPALWDESLVTLELAKNAMLPFFANSFLAVAGLGQPAGLRFPQLGVIFSSGRAPMFRTKTTIARDSSGRVMVAKRGASGATAVNGRLRLVDTDSEWTGVPSLHTTVYARSRDRRAGLATIFEPCRGWAQLLQSRSAARDGDRFLGGEYLDWTWSNVYPAGNTYTAIDQEWVWGSDLRLNVLIVRAIHIFLLKARDAGRLPKRLRVSRGKTLIRDIARTLGVELTNRDFADFIELETELQSLAFGLSKRRLATVLRWSLRSRNSLELCLAVRRRAGGLLTRLTTKARSLLARRSVAA